MRRSWSVGSIGDGSLADEKLGKEKGAHGEEEVCQAKLGLTARGNGGILQEGVDGERPTRGTVTTRRRGAGA